MKMKKQRQKQIIIGVFLVLGLIVITMFSSQQTIKQLGTTDTLTTFDTESGKGTHTFLFDDFKFVVEASDEQRFFDDCDEINSNSATNVRVIGKELGCDIYEYNKKQYKCETDGRCDDNCDQNILVSANKRGDSCEPTESRYREYCKKYCDYDDVVISEKTYTEGGPEFGKRVDGCFWYADIYYNDKKILEMRNDNVAQKEPIWFKGSERVYLSKDGKIVDKGEHFYELRFGSSYSEGGVCKGITGGVKLLVPKSKVAYSVENPTGAIFTDENRDIVVTVSQDLATFTSTLFIDYEISTQIGSATKTETEQVVINPGVNIYRLKVPTEEPTNLLKVTPRMELYYDISSWTHIRSSTDTEEPDGFVGTIIGDTSEFLINPKLNWLEKELCGENCEACDGYSISADNTICVNQEVKDVSCAVIGCPIVEGHQIMCMSSGFCSEIVEVFIDREIAINETECNVLCAPLGGVCQLSDNKDWFCVDKEIVEVIEELPTPIYISKTCKDFDLCDKDAGFECVDRVFDSETIATCERTVEKTVTETRKESNMLWYIIVIIIAVILFIISFRRLKK